MATQTEAIRAHLEAGRDLTPLDALRDYGCMRLAARVDELRREGLEIQTITERRGRKSFARYRLVGQRDLFSGVA